MHDAQGTPVYVVVAHGHCQTSIRDFEVRRQPATLQIMVSKCRHNYASY
jgi:hypothetical protein